MNSTQKPQQDDARPYVRPWVRKLSYPLVLASGCISSYLFTVWATHFVSAVRIAYTTLVEVPNLEETPLDGTATDLLQLLPEHAERCLTWIYGTDVSTISGLLILLFVFGVTRGLWYLSRGAAPLVLLPGAPFGCQYKTLWVQLGLTGTLVAFMMIGFGLDDSGEIAAGPATVSILVQAFGTAILSTLVAVVLAYILAPGFQWALRYSVAGISFSRDGIQRAELEALVWLDRTVSALKSAADTLESSPKSIRRTCQEIQEAFTNPLSHINGNMKTIAQELQGIGGRADANNARLIDVTKERSDYLSQSIRNLAKESEPVARLLASSVSSQTELLKSVQALIDRDRAQVKAVLNEQRLIRQTLTRIEHQQSRLLSQARPQECRYVSGDRGRAAPGPRVLGSVQSPITRFLGWFNGRTTP